MIKCQACGHENEDGEVFCTFCAALLSPPSEEGDASASAGEGAPGAADAAYAAADVAPVAEDGASASGEAAERTRTDEAEGSGDAPLDPLDEFLKSTANVDFRIEEYEAINEDFEHIEEELDDAERARRLKEQLRKVKQFEAAEGSAGEGSAGSGGFEELDAIIESEARRAREKLEKSPEGDSPAPGKAAAAGDDSKAELVKRLERFKKYLDTEAESGVQPGLAAQSSEIIRYLEQKIARQAVEIERLKQEKAELINEVFEDALTSQHDRLKDELELYKSRVAKMERDLAEALRKRAAVEEKLVAKTEQLAALLEERNRLRGEIERRVKEELASEIREKLKARLEEQAARFRKVEEEYRNRILLLEEEKKALKSSAVELQERVERLMKELEAARSSPELEKMKRENEELRVLCESLRKSHKEGVRHLSRYYESLIGKLPTGVVAFDTDWKLMLVNRAALSLLGLSLDTPYAELSSFLKASWFVDLCRRLETEPVFSETVPHKRGSREGDIVVRGYVDRLGERELRVLILEFTRNADSDEMERRKLQLEEFAMHLKERLFSLKLLSDIFSKKADSPETVRETAAELGVEIDKLVDELDSGVGR